MRTSSVTTSSAARGTAVIIVIGVAVLIACALVFAVNRMNAHELETLRKEADERGQSYEVIIHNELLNTYSFELR